MEASAIPATVGLAGTRGAIGAPLLRIRSDEQLVSMFRSGNDEAFRASLTKVGFWPLRPRSEAEIKEFMEADRARWFGVVKKLNFSLD